MPRDTLAKADVALRLAVLAAFLLAPAAAARPAEIVLADGRRETVENPRQDSQGRWMATRDGRRTPLKPGEVVVIVDDSGKATVTIPSLVEAARTAETDAAIANLRDPKNEDWLAAAEKLAETPSRASLDGLVALAMEKSKESRRRAVHALARLRTRESVAAATEAILSEKDASLRRELASVLFSVQEIFKRCDLADAVARGIADKDAGVRVVFALLSPPDLGEGNAVLEKDGLESADHHTRESAALELARRGNGKGESVLLGMLARAKLPGFDGSDALMTRLLVDEQVEVCRALTRLSTPRAKAALEKAASSSRHEPVRKAAENALAEATGK